MKKGRNSFFEVKLEHWICVDSVADMPIDRQRENENYK